MTPGGRCRGRDGGARERKAAQQEQPPDLAVGQEGGGGKGELRAPVGGVE